MNLAVMQPYVFPYLGYFQLLGAVDKFVVYDDVAFIKKGWVNRNNILVDGKAHLFSIPLKDVSQFRTINETFVDGDGYGKWQRKFLMTIDRSYRKAPFFGPVRELLESVLDGFEGTVSALAQRSLRETAGYLGLVTTTIQTSDVYGNESLKGQARILDICQKEAARRYVNPIGGMDLYRAADFAAQGIALNFIRSKPVQYQQFGAPFTPSLSIIDVMMFNSPARIGDLLREFEFL
jgi:hypothetical protein